MDAFAIMLSVEDVELLRAILGALARFFEAYAESDASGLAERFETAGGAQKLLMWHEHPNAEIGKLAISLSEKLYPDSELNIHPDIEMQDGVLP